MSDLNRSSFTHIGFIGLGVMGSAQCARLVSESGLPVTVWDISEQRVAELVALGAGAADSAADLAERCDLIFLSLPGENEVRAIVTGPGGLRDELRSGTVIVDLSTVPAQLPAEMSLAVAARGAVWCDAPVARTKQAAIDGTLAIMVGCDSDELYEKLLPVLSCMGTTINHCGRVGAGAILKLANNTITFQSVLAISEVFAMARRSGLVDPETFFAVLENSSAQSYVMERMAHRPLVTGEHPSGTFPAKYMLKDLGYALASADAYGLDLRSARLAAEYLKETCEAGFADEYHTAVVRIIERSAHETSTKEK